MNTCVHAGTFHTACRVFFPAFSPQRGAQATLLFVDRRRRLEGDAVFCKNGSPLLNLLIGSLQPNRFRHPRRPKGRGHREIIRAIQDRKPFLGLRSGRLRTRLFLLRLLRRHNGPLLPGGPYGATGRLLRDCGTNGATDRGCGTNGATAHVSSKRPLQRRSGAKKVPYGRATSRGRYVTHNRVPRMGWPSGPARSSILPRKRG